MAPGNVSKILVGNKIDLTKDREVSEMEGREMSERFNTKYFESSAKTGENINQIFNHISREILSKRKDQE